MRSRTLGNRISIYVVGAQIILLFALSTLPTPLYESYAQKFQFSNLLLTVMFVAYTIGTITTLLFLGRLSDQIGRRRISLTALGLGGVAIVLFILALNYPMLFAARVITGLATGLSSGTAIAWMRDLHGPGGQRTASQKTVTLNILGLGLGPLLSGLLAAFAPWPMVLTFIIFGLLLALLAIGIFFAEETAQDRRDLKKVPLRPRIGVPRELRSQFAAPALTVFVSFSLVGFYSVIAPSLLAKTLQLHSPAVIGSVVFELFLAGTIMAYVAFKFTSRASMLAGTAMMLPALAGLVISQEAKSLASLLVGTALGGVSIGLAYKGTLEIANQIAPEDKRAEMISSLFVVGNLSLAIPVIGVGVLAALTSSHTANLTFAVVVGLLSIVGWLLGKRLRIQAQQ